MADGVRIERDGAVLILRFNRPEKKNAITGAMYHTLAGALEDADHDDEVGACVLLGSPGAFSAGNDIADLARMASEGALGAPVLRFLRALAGSQRPLMAGVDGLAVGVGATLLLHCDYVLATPQTVLRTPFTALGLVPEAASSLLAPRLMGHARAFELLVTGRDMSAEAARDAGLINRIVPSEELETVILAAAHDLAGKPREAVLASRRLLKGDPVETLTRIELEARLFAERLKSAEAQAAFGAFLRKAKP
jgi:enoyl-CoA hydratase/carnithine racemase